MPMASEGYYLLAGASLLAAVLLSTLLRKVSVSPALVLLAGGAVIGLTPVGDSLAIDVTDETHLLVVEHVTELTVIVALMGVGLALDRPLHLLRRDTWRTWSSTWRLLALAMPLTIGAVALLGWGALGLAPATALLLGAALASTDPVLASDVQVGAPGSAIEDDTPDAPYGEDPTTRTEAGEVRFALTSEAGLNDGLAFPFVYAAVLLLAGGSLLGGVAEWASVYVVAKVVGGVAVGVLLGRGLGLLAFRSRAAPVRFAAQSEPLLAVAALLTAYGVAELVHGYGFLAVFACAMALRSAERRHDYHRTMHSVVQRLERLLTLAVLLVLGISLSSGLLAELDWRGVTVGLALVFVVRPLAAWLSLQLAARRDPLPGGMDGRSRLAVAFFGVRGVGSLFYLAWASLEAEFSEIGWVWSTVGFTVALSVVVHGMAAAPVMRLLEGEPAVLQRA